MAFVPFDPDATQPIPDSLPFDSESVCTKCWGRRTPCVCAIGDAFTERVDAILPPDELGPEAAA